YGRYLQLSLNPSELTHEPFSTAMLNQQVDCFAGWSRTKVSGEVNPPSESFRMDQSPARTAALVGGSESWPAARSNSLPAVHPMLVPTPSCKPRPYVLMADWNSSLAGVAAWK